jgi:hypothetical protein
MLTNQFLRPMIQDFSGYTSTVHYLGKLTLKTLDKNWLQHATQWYQLSPLCHLNPLRWFAMHIFILSYGLMFWGNSPHGSNIFKIQKTIIRIITGCRKDSCRNLFKKLKILPLQSQYILSILLFVGSNKNQFKIISDVHHISTRRKK